MTHATVTFLLILFLIIPSVDARSQPRRDTLFEIVTLIRDLFEQPRTHTRMNALVFGQDALQTLPYRERDELLRLLPGVYELNGNLHVQGGRPHDLGHYINGVRLTNRYLGTSELHIIPEAIESLSLSTGGYGASKGFATAGIVETQMRTGGDDFRIKASLLTDNIVKTGNEFFNTTSFGYRTSVLTAGGVLPVGSGIRFFIAGENHFVRNRQARFVEPFRYDSLRTDIYDIEPGRLLPGPVAFSKNFIPNNWLERNTVQGTLLYQAHPFSVQLTGSYQHNSSTTGAEWPSALVTIFNQRRVPKTNVASGFLSLAGTYNPSDDITVNTSVTYYNRASELVDPDFGTDWRLFSDSIANAQRGFSGFRTRWQGPVPYSVISVFEIRRENQPSTSFSKDDQRAFIGAASISAKINDDWDVKLGGEYETWRIRRFSTARIDVIMQYLYGIDGTTPRTFRSDLDRRIRIGRLGNINNFGYDVDGNATDGGLDEPGKPVFASAFLDHSIRFEGATVDAGLRYEHYNPSFRAFEDPYNIPYDQHLDAIDESKLVRSKPVGYLLPRFRFSIVLSGKTTVDFAYDKYTQMPPLVDLYAGAGGMNYTFDRAGHSFLPPFTFGARPERSTRYGITIHHNASTIADLSLALFVKDVDDLLMLTRLQGPYSHPMLLNGDNATIKGMEFSAKTTRYKGFAATLHYALSDAVGTSSQPFSHRGRIELQLPAESAIVSPLDFQQTHKATLMLDYLSGGRDDLLSDIGVAAILSYGSGHRYTRLARPTGGAVSPVYMGVLNLSDPRAAIPVEPVNNSTTPPTLSVDVRLSKEFVVGPVTVELYALALNLFDKKNIINVYPTTGSDTDDGWFGTQPNAYYSSPLFDDFYRTINLQNRWAYSRATGNDLYGSPRQIRFGMRIGL